MVEASTIEAPAAVTPIETVKSLSLEQISTLRELALKDLYVFAKGVMGFTWLVPHIHIPLCKLLEEFETKPRAKVCIPRGWLKTTICSQAYPLWRAIKDPEIRVLLAQNTYTNACAKLRVIRKTVEGNELFRRLFPEVLPDSTCTWKADSLELKRNGTHDESTFEAAGTRTQVVSRHYNLIIEDDTVAPGLNELGEESVVPVKADIEQAIGWHRLAAPLLVSTQKGVKGQILVVGTRWFKKDLLSWIDENESKWYFCYTRACMENEQGEPDEQGKFVYPERFDDFALQELRTALGPYMFSCLYMNQPIRSRDMIFHQDWFKYYETEPKNIITYITVDLGGDPEDTKGVPDWNVVMTCGKDLYRGDIYVLDYQRKKCSPGELTSMVFDQVRKWKPVKVGIESFAYQKSILYWMRERMRKEDTFFHIEQLTNTKKSKGARIQGLQPLIAAGQLRFRQYMSELISELLVFPLGAHDDLADALAMQLEMWVATAVVSNATKAFRNESAAPLSVSAAIEEVKKERKAKSVEVQASPYHIYAPDVFTFNGFGDRSSRPADNLNFRFS